MDTEAVKKLADLARLTVPDSELAVVAKDIENILGFIDRIREVSLEGETMRDLERVNVLRDDIVAPLHSAYDLVECAPLHADHFVKVPKVIE